MLAGHRAPCCAVRALRPSTPCTSTDYIAGSVVPMCPVVHRGARPTTEEVCMRVAVVLSAAVAVAGLAAGCAGSDGGAVDGPPLGERGTVLLEPLPTAAPTARAAFGLPI